MMSDHGGKTYRPWEPQRYQQEAHSPAAKLPEGDLVFFLLDTVPQLDLSRFYAPYEQETRGAPPFDPAMMVCLWLYAYCVGVFSSRKIAQACERNLAFMAIVGQGRPDFRTLSDFRKLHLDAFMDVFVQVVRLAGEAGLVKLGNVSTDGTKIQGNASRHKAMSYGYMKKEVERLREEMEALVTQASRQDEAEDAALGSRRGDELPAELARREDRLATIEAAMQRLEARAKAEAEAERQRRAEAEAERQRTGKKRRGKTPKPVDETPADKAQSNFTDPELHIMQTNNKGWDYCGNAQASVDGASQIILACEVSDASNDKQQAEPVAQATLVNLA
jgi:transposase